MRWLAVVALLALGAQDPVARRTYPSDGVFWGRDWYESFEEARLRNVPVHLACHDDGEESAWMEAAVYADKKFIEASRHWVNLASHPKRSHEIEIEVPGRTQTLCEKFWKLTCLEHMANEKFAVQFKNVGMRPVALFVKNGLVEAGRVEGKVSVAEMVRLENEFLAKWTGAHLTAGEWLEGKPDWEEGKRLGKEKSWRKAIDTFLKLRKSPLVRWKELVQEGLEPIEREGDKLVDEAAKMAAGPSGRAEGKSRLQQIVKDFTPLPCAQKASNTLKAIERR